MSDDPRLVAWTRDQAAALTQSSVDKRVRVIERTIGVPAKQVRTDLQGQITTVSGIANDALATADDAQTQLASMHGSTCGVGYLSFPGSSNYTGFINVSHGRSGYAQAILVSPLTQQVVGPCIVGVDQTYDGGFTVFGYDPNYTPPAGSSLPFSWLCVF